MDELEFRRRIYADPHTNDDEVIVAAKADPSKQAFWNEVKLLEQKLGKAVDIPVPQDLAHRLIWQQGVEQFNRKKKRSRRLFAIAASMAMVVGLSMTLWSQWLNADLQKQLLTHVAHADDEKPHSDLPANLSNLNAKLASFDGYLEQDIGEVKIANFCYLGAAKTLHLILKTAQGTLSVFVLPAYEERSLSTFFANKHFKGSLLTMNNRNVVVMGGQQADLSDLEAKLKQNLKFSA